MDKLVYKLPKKSLEKDYIFNMIGSLTNATVSVVLLIVVSRIMNDRSAGVFSLAYSTAQMMYTIGVFEMRNVQVTDSKRQFSFESVFMFRIITTLIMIAFSVFFIFFKHYTGIEGVLILMLTVYMGLQAFSDVFQGVLHLNGYLHLSGISLAALTFLALISFSVVLFFTRKLYIAVIPMIVIAPVWILIYDIPFASNFETIRPRFDFAVFKAILFCALPVFLSSFLQQYIFNSQKYAIYDCLTKVDQAHYGYLVMPTFFINLLSIFVFRPSLVSLSERWANGEIKSFVKTVRLLYGWIVLVMAAAIAGAYFLGIPILEMFYGADLSGEKKHLLVLLVAGGFSAGCSLTVILLTLIRKQIFGLGAYILVAALALFLPKILVSRFELFGACLSYTAEMAILFVVLIGIFIFFVLKDKGNRELITSR